MFTNLAIPNWGHHRVQPDSYFWGPIVVSWEPSKMAGGNVSWILKHSETMYFSKWRLISKHVVVWGYDGEMKRMYVL